MIQRTIAVGMFWGVLLGLLIDTWYMHGSKPIVYAREPEAPKEVLIEVRKTPIEWNKERIVQEIDKVAAEYGVDAKVMRTVINCESQYNPKALGDGGKSRGLVQIHSGYHNVTDEDAYDPTYAITFLAKHLKEGNGRLWSCYNMNYK